VLKEIILRAISGSKNQHCKRYRACAERLIQRADSAVMTTRLNPLTIIRRS